MPQTNPMTASISFHGSVACGGAAALVLEDNGLYTFNGHFHDAGFVPYDVVFALVVRTTRGSAFSFTKSGKVSGTVDLLVNPSASRDFSWNDSLNSIAIERAWPEIAAGFDYHWKADVNVELNVLISDVVALVKASGPLIGEILSIV